jgi:RNA 2',3'-cyclic 3'-phosphodiesterase
LDEFEGRKIPLANWHLTLHFLGSIDENLLLKIHEAIDELSLGLPFKIIFDHLGAFPKLNKARSLWVGAHEGSLQMTELVKITGESLIKAHLRLDPRPYVVHITVRKYNPPQTIQKLIETSDFQPVQLLADRIVFYESILDSGAPHYKELYTYYLSPQ